MALKSSTNIEYHESNTYPSENFRDGVYFSLRIRGSKRIYMRDRTGRETLVQETNIAMKTKNAKILPKCLHNKYVCCYLVNLLLRDEGIHERIRDFVGPKITKEVIKLKYPKENKGKGFMIETEVGLVEKTWFGEMTNHDDDSNSDDSCAICLEALGESRITKLLCSHGFHKDCIIQWLGHNLSCPTCRYNVV